MIESAPTAERVVAALRAGTLDVRTEEWRQRLAATGLDSADVRLVLRAVDCSRETLGSMRSCAFAMAFSFPLVAGFFLFAFLLSGSVGGTSEARAIGFTCGAIFLAMAAATLLWGLGRRWWGMAMLAGVEPILVTALFPAAAGSVQGIQKTRIVYLKDRFSDRV